MDNNSICHRGYILARAVRLSTGMEHLLTARSLLWGLEEEIHFVRRGPCLTQPGAEAVPMNQR